MKLLERKGKESEIYMEAKELTQAAHATEKLFYTDSHLAEFEATVISCEEWKEGYRIVLDRTAFFPEGGGQFGDTGVLYAGLSKDEKANFAEISEENASGGMDVTEFATEETLRVEVIDTKEKQGIVYHITREPLAEGTAVHGNLNFAERFDRMQQHTGEHIVSGIVHALYGCDNVGFHLGAEFTTLDFNLELTQEQAEEVEMRANRAVFANIPVQVLYPSKEELKTMDYRSKIEIEGQVRIVSIPGIDMCACCAPHTNTTGEVGLIKILSCDRHRGGCRMVMVSGMRALKDYQRKQRSVTEVSVALSAKPEKIGEAVVHVKEQQMKLRERLNQMQASYLKKKLEEIRVEDKVVCIFEEEMDNVAVRNFVNDAMERCDGICGAFVGADESGYRYILGSKTLNLREVAKQLNAQFGGKGGGKPEMVQGSFASGTAEEIAAALQRWTEK